MRIVFVGDSLTEFFDWQARFPEHEVVNLGVAGETAEGLLFRLERIRGGIDDPRFVFVMTGANNIAMEDYGILTTYGEILSTLGAWFKDSRIVVQSVLPMILPWIDRGVIKRLNLSLKEIAEGVKADYLDLYRLFTDREGRPISAYLLDDGVHLSNEGYEVWSGAVEAFLTSQGG